MTCDDPGMLVNAKFVIIRSLRPHDQYVLTDPVLCQALLDVTRKCIIGWDSIRSALYTDWILTFFVILALIC